MVPWLDNRTHLERTVGPAQRHDFLEPFILRVNSEPERFQAELVFLLVVFEPVRGAVVKAMREARFREPTDFSAIPKQRRQEARFLAELERNELDRAATQGLLEALSRYPAPRPNALFPWIKNATAHQLLDQLREEARGMAPMGLQAAEHAAVQNTLHDLAELDAPAMATDSPRRRKVLQVAVARDLPELASHYADHHHIRDSCRRAAGRLAPRQRQVVDEVLLGDYSAAEFAERRRVTRSTIDNLASQARRTWARTTSSSWSCTDCALSATRRASPTSSRAVPTVACPTGVAWSSSQTQPELQSLRLKAATRSGCVISRRATRT